MSPPYSIRPRIGYHTNHVHRAQSNPQYLERPTTAGNQSASENLTRNGQAQYQSRSQGPPPSLQHAPFSYSGSGSGPAAPSPQVNTVHAPQPHAPSLQSPTGDWAGTERQPHIGQTPSRPASTSFAPSRSSGDGAHAFLPNGHPQSGVRQRI